MKKMFTKDCFHSFIWILLCFHGICSGLRIEHLTIPKTVRANSSEVILDCNYKVEEWEKTNGFVLKWYINSVNLVYQWIPPRPPTILGSLRGRLDPTYRASEDPWEEHRALRIINPSPSLTGTYSCAIATFEGEDTDSDHLLIWAPPSDVRLKYWRPSAHIVNISCSSKDASPKPFFKLYIVNPNGTRRKIEIRDRKHFPGSSQGLYDSQSWGQVDYKTLATKSTIGCFVSTKGKLFHEKRETIYHADTPIITTTTTTTSTPGPEEEAIKSPSIASLAISSQNLSKAVGFKMTLLLFIVFLRRVRRDEYWILPAMILLSIRISI